MRSSSVLELLELLVFVLVSATWTVAVATASSSSHDSHSSSSHFVSVCNLASEPTFGEIFSFVSPVSPALDLDLVSHMPRPLMQLAEEYQERYLKKEGEEGKGGKEEHHWLLVRAFKELLGGAGRALAETPVPLASLVSDGVFTLSASRYQGLVVDSEIKLLQKKPFLQRQMCALARALPLPAPPSPESNSSLPMPLALPLAVAAAAVSLASPCQCWGGGLSLADAGLSAAALLSGGGGVGVAEGLRSRAQEHDWCVLRDPCQEEESAGAGAGAGSDVCSIRVDPLRPACAVFLVTSKEEGGDADAAADTGAGSASYYRFEVPTLLDASPSLLLHANSWLSSQLPPPLAAPSAWLLARLLALPYYPCVLLLAAGFLAVEDGRGVSGSAAVQLAVTALLGVLLAAIALVALIYRNLQSLQSRLPLASLLPSFLSSSLLFLALGSTGYSLRQAVCSQLWGFWREGAFGYPWAGKIYFAASVSLSLLLKWRYRWFRRGSSTRWALRSLLQLAGLGVLALQASPSLELGLLFALLCHRREALLGWLQDTRVEVVGRMLQTPSIQYSGRAPLTEAQYEQQGQEHTARALAALQRHLEDHPSEVHDLTDRYLSEGQQDRGGLLKRFVEGGYSGKPREQDWEDEEEEDYSSDSDSGNGEDGGDVSDCSSDSDGEYERRRELKEQRQQQRQEKRAARAKAKARGGGGALRRVVVMLLVCALVAFVYRPVSRLAGGGGGGAGDFAWLPLGAQAGLLSGLGRGKAALRGLAELGAQGASVTARGVRRGVQGVQEVLTRAQQGEL